ncbi:MAG: PQQ-binding-like beta-propeller repeat protein [Armatimonadetes bacterium]|nr:PQQ-binding-like beta-propeller repeat protein [Armatimonadota bacterium]
MKMRTRIIIYLVATAILFVVSGDPLSAAGQWPTFRHDANRTGMGENGSLIYEKPVPIWIFPYPEKEWREPNNVIDDKDSVGRFNATPEWQRQSADAKSPDAYADDYLYAMVTNDGGEAATWTFEMADSGAPRQVKFYIYVWFPSYVSGFPHTTDAQYSVVINGETVATFSIDQTSGGNWVPLGTSPFKLKLGAGGDTLQIRLTNKTFKLERPQNTIVIADAVKIEQDTGVALSSPIASNENPIVVVPRIETRLKPVVGTQTGRCDVGVVYGVGTEADSGIPTQTDDRGWPAWQFPSDENAWIEGGFSSTPAIGKLNGQEVAFVAGADGTIYALRTDAAALTDAERCVWRGPGWFVDDSDVVFTSSSGSWVDGPLHGGYQGIGYHHVMADANGDSKFEWFPEDIPAGSYAIYAWIPPSTADEPYISDARYTIKVGTKENPPVIVDQRDGGKWIRLGGQYIVQTGERISITLTNKTSLSLEEPRYVAADMIKVVPSELGSFQFSSPVVDDISDTKRLYIGSTSGRVYALQPGEPEPVWVYPPPDKSSIGAIYASPALDGTVLYVGSSDGRVYAINATTGNLLWVYPPDPAQGEQIKTLGQISSTTAIGDYVYVCTGGYSPTWGPPDDPSKQYKMSGRIIALSKSDGSLQWMYPPANQENKGAFLYSSPLIIKRPGEVDPILVVGSSDGNLYAVNAKDGRGLVEQGQWESYPDLFEAIYSSPAGVVIPGSNIPMAFVGTESNRIYGIDLRNGTEKKIWSYSLYGRVTSSPALSEGRMYVTDTAGATWAFSSRSGGGVGGLEDFNRTIDPNFEPEDTSGAGENAEPEVDIFPKEIYDKLQEGTAPSDLPDNLHTVALGYPRSGPLAFEWGEAIYVIAWNLRPPKDSEGRDVNEGKEFGDDGFKEKTESNCVVIFKSRGPGEESDQSQSFTMSSKGCFKGKDTGEYIHWAKYCYVLDNSSHSKPQSPGSRITVSVQERPGGNDKKAVPGDSVVPDHSKGMSDRNKYVPQILAINNPLGLVYNDTTGIGVSASVGVEAQANLFKTRRNLACTSMNGNDLIGYMPWVEGGVVSHGTSSEERIVNVCDRSLLFRINQRIDKFRVERQDLAWTGGPDRVVNPLPWDTLPPYVGINSSLDYPDIRSRNLSCVMASTREDPTQGTVSLWPSVPIQNSSDEWAVGVNPVLIQYTIPRFQPANVPNGVSPTALEWRNSGYTGKVYFYVDSNRDGRLNKPAELGQSVLIQRQVSGARAEAYREVEAQVHVPVDQRVEVVEKTIDIGKVPQGFGFTVNPNTGLPMTFLENLGDCLLSWNGPKRGFGEWFKPFTVYNLGNVNLMNIRLARKVEPPGSRLYSLDLYSDTVQDPFTGGSGNVLPADCVVSSLDPRFQSSPGFTPLPNLPPLTRTFHKARVGESPTVLRIPDVPDRWLALRPGLTPTLPVLSVAVPIGQPVGTYSQKFTLYHDWPQAEEIYRAGESLGNPIIEVKVTVTEARLTDGTTPGTLPQIDAGASINTGDMSPAAYIDPQNGNLHIFWSSSRYGGNTGGPSASTPVASDPWYLYQSTLPWLGDRWGFAAPVAGQWWSPTNANAAFPNPSGVADFFPQPPEGASGSLLPGSVRFSNPSVAVDKMSGRAWLFFGGQAYKDQTTITGVDQKVAEHRVFYTELVNGSPSSTIYTTTHDWTMPKYGIRGLATRIGSDPSNSRLWLWSFWYGGNNNKWRLYFNGNPNPDGPNAESNWSNDAQLSVPRGLTSVAEPVPLFRLAAGRTTNVIDVVYSGFSAFHKNSDIYLSRYKVPQKVNRDGSLNMDIVTLPEIRDEELTRDAKTSIWYSRHVDWDASKPSLDSDDPPSTATSFTVQVVDPVEGKLKLNVGKYIQDSQTHALIFDYSDNSDPLQVKLKGLYRAVIINPEEGTVKFLRTPEAGARILATYKPKGYRLTIDDVSDVSPFVLLDSDPNPRYRPGPGNPFVLPNADYPEDIGPPVDRLWLFWRRPAPGGKGTGLYYKAFRNSIKLNKQVAVTPEGVADVESVTVVGAYPPLETPVETDWVKNRLYFTSIEEGKRVEVRYKPAGSSEYITEQHTVTFQEEPDAKGNAFGYLTDQIINEGQIYAIKNTYSNALSSEIWVFWTSTRSGNTDLYFETICPRFYGARY